MSEENTGTDATQIEESREVQILGEGVVGITVGIKVVLSQPNASVYSMTVEQTLHNVPVVITAGADDEQRQAIIEAGCASVRVLAENELNKTIAQALS